MQCKASFSCNISKYSKNINQVNILMISLRNVFMRNVFTITPRNYDGDFLQAVSNFALHKKWSFPLKISSVNVTKYADSCRFGHIYWRNP